MEKSTDEKTFQGQKIIVRAASLEKGICLVKNAL